MTVYDDEAPHFEVRVAYGTSQRTTKLHSGEFVIASNNRAAYEAAGLSYDIKFDFQHAVDLPFTSEWFAVPPAAPHGQSPKLGTVHPSLVLALQGAT